MLHIFFNPDNLSSILKKLEVESSVSNDEIYSRVVRVHEDIIIIRKSQVICNTHKLQHFENFEDQSVEILNSKGLLLLEAKLFKVFFYQGKVFGLHQETGYLKPTNLVSWMSRKQQYQLYNDLQQLAA